MPFNVLIIFQHAPQAPTARTVVTAATTAGEVMCVTMKMGRVQMDVIQGIQGISANKVLNLII